MHFAVRAVCAPGRWSPWEQVLANQHVARRLHTVSPQTAILRLWPPPPPRTLREWLHLTNTPELMDGATDLAERVLAREAEIKAELSDSTISLECRDELEGQPAALSVSSAILHALLLRQWILLRRSVRLFGSA